MTTKQNTPDQKAKVPLHLKISVLNSIFLLSYSILAVMVTSSTIEDILSESFKSDTRQLLTALYDKSELVLLFESQEHKNELLEILNKFSFVVSYSLQTPKGESIIEYNSDLHPQASDVSESIIVYEPFTEATFRTNTANSSELGTMTLRTSLKRLQAAKEAIMQKITILCIAFLLISISFYFYATRTILAPLYDTIAIMKKSISDHKYSKEAQSGSTREFHELAQSYNTMMSRIREANSALDQANQELKQEILEKEKYFEQQKQLEEQLSQSQKLEAIGRMTAAISHDFNNILGGILGFNRLAQDELCSLHNILIDQQEAVNASVDDIHDSLREIALGGQRAQNIIRQLLVFSRKAHAKPSIVDVEHIVKQIYPFLRTSLPSNIGIKIALEKKLAIRIDPTHFEQMIVNLVINARDAMDFDGQIEITSSRCEPNNVLYCASCRHEIQSSNQEAFIKVTIIDNGIGIPQEHIDSIFDPFFTTKPKEKGSGMGLSILHGLVHKHQGHIFVQSSTEGTAISLYFPQVSTVEENTSQSVVTTVQTKSTTPDNILPIMLVDDNEQLLKFMTLFLQKNGYKIEAFNRSSLALRRFIEMKGAYLAVISDFLMPKINGHELCNAITKYKPDTHIIICSGFNEQLHQAESSIPNALYMTKPIDHELLLSHIRAFSLNYFKEG